MRCEREPTSCADNCTGRNQRPGSRSSAPSVRRKEIAYEQLLKRLDDLHKQVRESKEEIKQYKDDRAKQENVRKRVEALTGNRVEFSWN